MPETTKNKPSGVLKTALTAFANAIGLKVVAEADAPTADDTPAPSATTIELADGGGNLYCDGELAEGVTVYTDEAMTMLAGAGDYSLADGRTVTVDDAGAVTTIAAASNTSDDAPADDAADATTIEAQIAAAVAVAVAVAVAAQVAPLQAQLARTQSDLKAAQARLKTVPGTKPRESGDQAFADDGGKPKDQLTQAAAFFRR